MNCPICELKASDTNKVCIWCGYNFEKYKITDKDKLYTYYHKLKNTNKWINEIRLKWRLKETLRLSLGELEYYLRDFKGARKSNLWDDVNLAKKLDKYPQLSNCKTKFEARKRLKVVLEGYGNKFIDEKNLQKYLFENWEMTPFGKEWSLFKEETSSEGKYRTGDIGEIDLLARHREKNHWLVIELKIGVCGDKTIGQIKRYMGWVKEKLANEKGVVQGLIISEATNDKTFLALKASPDIELKIYQFDGNELKFRDPDAAKIISHLKRLDINPKQLNRLIKKIDDSK